MPLWFHDMDLRFGSGSEFRLTKTLLVKFCIRENYIDDVVIIKFDDEVIAQLTFAIFQSS